jgi:flagellar motility protein MotE (MotC chaperone)
MKLSKIRLLPVTIAVMSSLLLVKTILLVEAVAGETAPPAKADETARAPDAAPAAPAPDAAPAAPAPDAAPTAPAPDGAPTAPAPDGAPTAPAPDGAPTAPVKEVPPGAAASPSAPNQATAGAPEIVAQNAAPASIPAGAPASVPPAAASSGPPAAASGMPPAAVPSGALAPGVNEPPQISDAERSILLDLRKRRDELDSRARALDDQRRDLDAANKRLSDRIQQLSGLQTRLEAMEAERQQQKEQNWAGLVKVYENMKPRDAATIFDALDMQVLLQVLDRMQARKMAPILAAMQPDRARLATQMLAEMRTRAVTPSNTEPKG